MWRRMATSSALELHNWTRLHHDFVSWLENMNTWSNWKSKDYLCQQITDTTVPKLVMEKIEQVMELDFLTADMLF